MELSSLVKLSKERLLPAVLEVDGHLFPEKSERSLPLFHLAFERDGIKINERNPLFNKKIGRWPYITFV